MTQPLKVAVLGCGSVGSQVVRLLDEHADDLAARIGARLELVGVAVRRLDAPREVEVSEGLLTTAAEDLVSRPEDLTADIALRWGFRNASHFTRLFRLRHGLTPTAYRRLGQPRG